MWDESGSPSTGKPDSGEGGRWRQFYGPTAVTDVTRRSSESARILRVRSVRHTWSLRWARCHGLFYGKPEGEWYVYVRTAREYVKRRSKIIPLPPRYARASGNINAE